jgi:hypothetical protein
MPFGDWLVVGGQVLKMEIDGLVGVARSFLHGLAVRNAAGQSGNHDGVPAFGFWNQVDLVGVHLCSFAHIFIVPQLRQSATATMCLHLWKRQPVFLDLVQNHADDFIDG